MSEFLRGWKRKFGVVTLVLACLLMAAFLRSRYWADEISIPCSQRSDIQFTSFDGMLLAIMRDSVPNVSIDWTTTSREDISTAITDLDGNEIHLSLREQLLENLLVGVICDGPDDPIIGLQIPYMPFVIILTLLSAYLLLSKRRKLIQSFEPIPAEGP